MTPYPDLSRIPEWEGYLIESCRETGDKELLDFWYEIRASIYAPIKDWIEENAAL
jgi:hypothetical protein